MLNGIRSTNSNCFISNSSQPNIAGENREHEGRGLGGTTGKSHKNRQEDRAGDTEGGQELKEHTLWEEDIVMSLIKSSVSPALSSYLVS